MSDIVEGDRVILTDPQSWCQPLRGYALARRGATVLGIFTPQGSNHVNYRIRFDMRSYKNDRSGVEIVQRRHIEKVSP